MSQNKGASALCTPSIWRLLPLFAKSKNPTSLPPSVHTKMAASKPVAFYLALLIIAVILSGALGTAVSSASIEDLDEGLEKRGIVYKVPNTW